MKWKLLCMVMMSTCPAWRVAAAEMPSSSESDDPLWEVGVFAGAAQISHYRGSDENETYVVPFPYFIYRGRIFRSDRGGVSGRLIDTEHFVSSISFSGSPPTYDGNEARRGMPDLDPLLEIGPALRWHPLGRSNDMDVYFQAAGRAVTSIAARDDFDIRHEGFLGTLSLNVGKYGAKRGEGWTYGGTLAAVFGNKTYHGYFYDVDSSYVTAGRPAYDASGGYGGLITSAFLMHHLSPTLSIGIFARWDGLHGAAFEDSPLVRRTDSWTGGGALVWSFARSKKKARGGY